MYSFIPRESEIFNSQTLKNECYSTADESLNMLISHGIALSSFDKIADYLNREKCCKSIGNLLK